VVEGGAPGAPTVRWGLGEAVVAYLAGTVLSLVASGIAQSAVDYHPVRGSSLPVAVTVAGLVGLWAGLAGGVVYATRAKGSGSLAEDFGLRVQLPWDVVGGVAVGLASQYAMVPLLYLPFEQFDHTLRRRLENQAKDVTRAAHGGLQVTVLFLFLVIGAPVVEELFFRGLLLRSLDRRFGTAAAVLGSALVFGLAHYELLQLPALILFGIVLAVLAERTGRLGPGIAAHAAFNAATVLSLTMAR
jgi:membrane protease YdiL (CAAX protease family)